MDIQLKAALADAITRATGADFEPSDPLPAHGGCINQASLLSDGSRRYFVKLNAASAISMFTAEAEALEAIHQTHTIKVPRPVVYGQAAGRAYLILEAISFGHGSPDGWHQMGQQFAALHRHRSESFGWHRDNTIGSTPQTNTPTENWASFFREQRLRPLFTLAKKNGYHFEHSAVLLDAVDPLLQGHQPEPSLLHGDLWFGNAGFTAAGIPVVYDPASYYGDRETDLAFSEFFGGFPHDFYHGYQSAWPLAPGYATRKDLYNLYHVLNHANLFGRAYASQAQNMIEQLLLQR